MKVLLFSQIMYGGAWRRNYNVIRKMEKLDKKIEYVLLLESSNAKIIPDVNEMIATLKELYVIKFIKLPTILNRYTQLHYIYIDKLGETFNNIINGEKVDLLYIPHEVDWWILAANRASRSAIPWTVLFHSMPLFVCILDVKINGAISTLLNAPSLMYKPLRIIRGLYRYFRLQKLVKALKQTLSFSVSKSISLNLRAFYPWLDVEALNPGIGIDLDYISSIYSPEETFDAIFFTSELIPHKGFLELPKIWKRVVQDIPNAKLLVVGKSNRKYLNQFLSLVEKLGLKRKIMLLELQPHKKLISLVKSSKLMVYPSTYDTFSMVVLESLASGVPVVAYDIPAIRLNYMTEGVIKCPVNNLECMAYNVVTLLSDDRLRRRLSQEAVKYATKFSWEKVAKAEAEMYRKVLDFWSSKF